MSACLGQIARLMKGLAYEPIRDGVHGQAVDLGDRGGENEKNE